MHNILRPHPTVSTISDLDRLIIETFDQENRLTEHVKPLVIDAGSVRRDLRDMMHTDACGWLAIEAALLYAIYTEDIPVHLWKRARAGYLRFEYLKTSSGCTYSNSRISDKNIEQLSNELRIHIVVWEKCRPTSFNKLAPFRIDLWLTGAHYYVFIRDTTQLQKVNEFVHNHIDHKYTVRFLAPEQDIQSDHDLAVMLSGASPDDQIATDECIAELLYLDELGTETKTSSLHT
jgi:hypothetical protein